MKEKVLNWMKEYKMTNPGDRIIVGLSGGADSVCLLHVLYQLKDELGIELLAIHVHHGLRGEEADHDAGFSERFSRGLGVPCTVVYQDVKTVAAELSISLEEAGRQARYQSFREAAGSGKIAVAHHQDDSAETILHHLFRGSGLRGLSGILPVRGSVIRPLLCVGRGEILEYLKEQGISYCDDSTNFENDYTRNRIRNQILPLAADGVNSHAVENLVRAGHIIGEADCYLRQQAQSALEGHMVPWEKGQTGIPVDVLLSQPHIIRKYMIRSVLSQGDGSGLRDLGADHLDMIIDLLNKGVGKRVDLPAGRCAWMDYNILWFKTQSGCFLEETGEAELEICFDITTFPRENIKEIPKNRYTKWFDYDKIMGMLSVRYRKTGDYITLSQGGRKTVKAYMIDEKIPARVRGQVPLVAEGDHVLWIVGYRISEYYKITEETRNILQIRFIGGETDGRSNQDFII